MDVSDAAQAAGLVDEVRGRVGVPDLVINSAGVARPGYFHKVDPQDFRWMMDINYFGAVNTIRAVVPAMIERGSGHIVNISSGVFFLPVFGYTAYGASKFALTGLSEILRAEMKAHGIRVSVVFPPNVDTPQLAYESQFRPPEARALMALDPILSPEVSPERMAAAILRGIKRGKFAIFASPADSLFYRVSRLLGGVAFLIMDRMSARAPKSESSR
jgi:3-dehydrosphinganine reductase